MKKTAVVSVFCAAVLISAGLRFCQILAFCEYETGFIRRDSKTAFIVTAVFIAVFVLSAAFFAAASSPVPAKSRAFGLFSSLLSLALGGAVAFDVFSLYSAGSDIPPFLKVLCLALGILTALYFAACGIRAVLYFPFSSKLAAIPPAFLTVRAACVFIACSRHAVVSDTVFEVLIYCASMLLFLEIARAVNGAGSRRSVKTIAFLGVFVSALSLVFALPKIVLACIYSAALHDSAAGAVIILALGLYLAAFVFSRLDFGGTGDKKLGVYYAGRH